MARTIAEIRDLKTYLVTDFYSECRQQQRIDDEFYNDTFKVTDIVKPPVMVMRTGRGRRMVDRPTDHIVTSNPQASRISKKDTQEETKVVTAVNNMLNIEWLPSLKKQNPNAFKQHVKFNMNRGEAWIQVVHNSSWVTGKKKREGLPIIFRLPDPMIVFASPNEDCNGVPEYVIMWYQRLPRILKKLYPDWSDPKRKITSEKQGMVDWLEYWDSEIRYWEADGEPVLLTGGKDDDYGIQSNSFGFVPFVHKLSGFGTDSPESKPEELVVGRLRFSRDSLRRDCALISSTDTAIHRFANRSLDVQPVDDMHEIPSNFAEGYEIGDGLIHNIPAGLKIGRAEELLPEQSVFQYLGKVAQDLEIDDPSVLSGMPAGESGRQQDMSQSSSLARYGTIVENAENAFATAIGMGLRMIDTIPRLKPDSLKSVDLDGNYDVSVKLKAADTLSDERKATLGSRMLAQNEIDPITNLVEFKGFTKEQAEEITIQKYAYRIIETNPDIAALIGWRAIQKSRMAEDIQQFKQQRQAMGKVQPQQGMTEQPGNTEMQRRSGETQTPEGFQAIDMALAQRGARQAPEPYTRGAV